MSITLTVPFTLSGSLTENDTQAAVISQSMDFLGNIGTLVFAMGTGAPANFNVGMVASAKIITLTVNMTTGAWSSSNGQSGTFSGAGFTSFQSQFKAIRNAGESFAAASITPLLGSQVAWT